MNQLVSNEFLKNRKGEHEISEVNPYEDEKLIVYWKLIFLDDYKF